jgi:hypothetical protein
MRRAGAKESAARRLAFHPEISLLVREIVRAFVALVINSIFFSEFGV